MVDDARSGGSFSTRPWEDRGGRAAGTIMATALAAGVIAFLLRRARAEEEPQDKALRFARSIASSDSVDASREFFMDKIVPELKPALLAILGELEDVVDQAFRRAEKNLKRL